MMKAGRMIGFHQIVMQVHKLKAFKLYSQNKLFTLTLFLRLFSVFLETGLGTKKFGFIYNIINRFYYTTEHPLKFHVPN